MQSVIKVSENERPAVSQSDVQGECTLGILARLALSVIARHQQASRLSIDEMSDPGGNSQLATDFSEVTY